MRTTLSESPSSRRRLRLAALPAVLAAAAVAAPPALAAPGFGPLDAAEYGRQLESTLGEDGYGGFWIEDGARKVAITDPALADDARAQGAQPKLVEHSLQELTEVDAELEREADSVPDNVAGWGVDVSRNAVVITVAGDDPEALAFAEQWQASNEGVEIEQVAEAPRTLWNLLGGQAITNSGSRCSQGFNARNAAGTRYVLTAGHCTNLGGTWSGPGGTIGPVSGTSFPTNDYGRITVTSSGAVSTSLIDRFSSGADVRVTGAATPTVGMSVCRSGSTTGWRCGMVMGVNQTVCYIQGCVSQAIRTNVCAEPGDSGGALVTSPSAGTVRALGVTSGGSGNCSSGGTTYYQPVNEPLSVYGLTLIL